MTYYKFITEKNGVLQNRDFVYKEGLNTIDNFDCALECTPNALYFTDQDNIHEFIEYGNVLYRVSYPEDAQVVKFDNKCKTDKLVLEERITDFDFLQDIYCRRAGEGNTFLCWIPEEHRTYEVCAKLNELPYILRDIYDKYITYELCMDAVKSYGISIRYVPERFKSYELCLKAIETYDHALHYIPDTIKTYEFCLKAIQLYKASILSVPEEHKTYELCTIAVQQGNSICNISPEHQTYELCILAIHNNGQELRYVSEEYKTYGMCMVAVKLHWEAIQFVPETFKTYELCLFAVNMGGNALSSVPLKHRTKELCTIAMNAPNNNRAFNHVPPELQSHVRPNFIRRALRWIGRYLQDI